MEITLVTPTATGRRKLKTKNALPAGRRSDSLPDKYQVSVGKHFLDLILFQKKPRQREDPASEEFRWSSLREIGSKSDSEPDCESDSESEPL